MSVTWLHVSDFHLSDKGPYNQNVILNALFSSVRRLRGECHAPDLIFATGDIAQNGKATEYAYATEFFNALLDAAGVTKKELFIVPGNHDVDRRMGKGLARTLESNDEADEYFDPEIPTPHLTQKFKAFSEWYNDYFEDIKAFPTNTTCSQVEVVSVNGCNVAILPLNSALFCIDDNDNNKLLIGRRCLGKTTEQLQCLVKADLNIALLHHPLDWLSLVERANIRAILGSKVDILLHGHYHETETEGIVLANGGYLKLAAGASYQTRQHPNSAMYATFDGNYVEIFPIHYVDKPQEIWTLDTGIFPTPPYTKRFLIPGIIFQNFIRIRGGLFIMGSPKNEVERGEDETEHEVQLSDFYLCRYAVTVAEFQEFIKASGYRTDAEKVNRTWVYEGGDSKIKEGINWRYGVSGIEREAGEYNHPVVHVSWNDADAYCKWYTVKTGKNFRLPTEAEWEYACRAGNKTPFNTSINITTDQANYNGNFPFNNNRKGLFRENTVAVNSFEPNAWGLFNMHGNVWEWCNDWYSVEYYDKCKMKKIVEDPTGAEARSNRVLRGGSWLNNAGCCRSAFRGSLSPGSRSFLVGFRMVLEQ